MNKANGIEKDIQVDLLSDEYLVRVDVDRDKVMQFGCLMLDGVTFPRINVFEKGDGSYLMGDGRHRLLAYKEVNTKMIPCIVMPKVSPKDILVFGFNANGHGSAPMTFRDAKHTIARLIELGASREYILQSFPFPKSRNLALYLEACSNIRNRRCGQALIAMSKTPSMSIEEAAKLFKIPPKQLARYMARQENKQSDNGNALKAKFVTEYKHLCDFTSRYMKKLMAELVDNCRPYSYVESILAVCLKGHGRQSRQLADWQSRFSAVAGNTLSYSIEQHSHGISFKPKTK